ncbi:MAG: hypothetical protein A3F53_00400 [Candidatus Zambryskibacteria bacterium RIFCSPHIGHO2_12_FULL_48_10]|uniref:PKD domain-containing protein n=1 Tax=Candidatus Zambryskibacteria bacterium RIFCSPHIGHO2_01_FULL_46_25 TaxID=1802738 RepID=A0A1G2T0J9_9BACT|nr:MAG: hypothetical protein A2838_03280 [Candidatus Zambryskibacteria bacterium RIFCSPHIGHO2_01_FULL_46_25]OHB00803.1 MAG: hypothetical protein A3F53_00400 [Candidatus Zambryskibacteria bacterium RIFCSPHIGHO2_12_FULL_48_10]OHB07138.1 MAG: hypothetical protein A3A31_00210 [Candidatus Zambryskibacteria bacterium RIFCSPLOWO2_01_FULL_48_25]
MRFFDKVFFKFLFITFVLALLPVFVYAQTLININTAGVAELDTLDGIGPAYAQRIVDYRNTNGPFQKIEDIKNVSGIGDATFSKIKDSITVGSAQTGATTATITQTSAHYSASPVSIPTDDTAEEIEFSAGRDRVGAVGSPIEFRVETNLTYSRQNIFSWNFGDGTQGGGPLLNHTYDYPGEYVVVLSASVKDREIISRVNVRIIDPKLSIKSALPERIEIENGSGQEVNLFGRALVSGEKIFAFPRDTIIRPGQSISFGSKTTGLTPTNVYGVTIMTIGESQQTQDILVKIEKDKAERAAYLQNQIALLRQQMANIPPPHLAVGQLSGELPAEPGETEVAELQTATAVKFGWLQTLKKFFLRSK